MSSFDGKQTDRRAMRGWIGVVLAGTLATLVGACTIQPVYMQVANGPNVSADLSAVTIDPATDRVGQQVRNNLILGFTGGRPPAPMPRYTLSLKVSTSEARLGFQRDDNAPAYTVEVDATYELKEIDTDRVILRSLNRGTASYDRSNQSFANTRARIDAQDRAAQVVADDIQLRLATALAVHR